MEGDLGGKSFPGGKGQRWDYSTEALTSPLDCFSMSLSICTHAHTCRQRHSAGSESRSGALTWTLLPESLWRGMGKEVREQSEQGCLHIHTWALRPAQEGCQVCPFLQSPGLVLNVTIRSGSSLRKRDVECTWLRYHKLEELQKEVSIFEDT